LPHLVPTERLIEANSLNALNNNLALLIGPALGGVLMGLLGLPGVVLLDSASFFIAGVMIWLIFDPVENPVETVDLASTTKVIVVTWKSWWHEWLEGLQFVTTNRFIRAVFVASGIAVLGEGIFTVLLIPFVGLLHADAVVLGWLLTIRGLGGLVGGLIVGLSSRLVPPNRLFPLSLGMIGLLALIMYNASSLPWALVILGLIGVPAMGAQVSSQTIFQGQVSDSLRGRVFGAFGTTVALLMLAGQSLASAIGDPVGIVATLSLGSGLYLLAGFTAVVMMNDISKLVGAKRIRA
jgi:MFS family permease